MHKELVEYIVMQLVDYPDRVMIAESTIDGTTKIEITVDPEDRGKVIGREGQTIKAIRALLSVLSPESGKVVVDLVRHSQ